MSKGLLGIEELVKQCTDVICGCVLCIVMLFGVVAGRWLGHLISDQESLSGLTSLILDTAMWSMLER